MALDDFWRNVRLASRMISPAAVTDSPRLHAADLAAALGDAAVWLTPRAVDGFAAADFAGLLPPADVDRLARHVAAFAAVARTVPEDEPAPPEAVERALPELVGILELLEIDRFADAEAFRVGKRIEADPAFPTDADARYRTTRDASGEPAVKIMVYLPDPADAAFYRRTLRLRDVISDLVFRTGLPYYPYVKFRVASDLAWLAAGVDE